MCPESAAASKFTAKRAARLQTYVNLRFPYLEPPADAPPALSLEPPALGLGRTVFTPPIAFSSAFRSASLAAFFTAAAAAASASLLESFAPTSQFLSLLAAFLATAASSFSLPAALLCSFDSSRPISAASGCYGRVGVLNSVLAHKRERVVAARRCRTTLDRGGSGGSR
eukprot:CAMPEP_0179950472 /NCGR_PEP_ID=MMETSP0983-20121128/22958_1 /TAXON_ID=483367 /ORGANISM="non described non described, Strain CCMP 2436" /LENGTH=168 /DNA_ID=CAMNT_0021860423 /DNA_START=272 /DNA_END=775 /DNA_ORIENTATION=-